MQADYAVNLTVVSASRYICLFDSICILRRWKHTFFGIASNFHSSYLSYPSLPEYWMAKTPNVSRCCALEKIGWNVRDHLRMWNPASSSSASWASSSSSASQQQCKGCLPVFHGIYGIYGIHGIHGKKSYEDRMWGILIIYINTIPCEGFQPFI